MKYEYLSAKNKAKFTFKELMRILAFLLFRGYYMFYTNDINNVKYKHSPYSNITLKYIPFLCRLTMYAK